MTEKPAFDDTIRTYGQRYRSRHPQAEAYADAVRAEIEALNELERQRQQGIEDMRFRDPNAPDPIGDAQRRQFEAIAGMLETDLTARNNGTLDIGLDLPCCHWE